MTLLYLYEKIQRARHIYFNNRSLKVFHVIVVEYNIIFEVFLWYFIVGHDS